MQASCKVLVGGTVAVDHVITPFAQQAHLLGGSASYAAMASGMFAPTALISIVGEDFPEEFMHTLQNSGCSLQGIECGGSKSFCWKGEYFANMNQRRTLQVDLNVLEHWQLKVPEPLRRADIVVLANMAPHNQLEMLQQCLQPKLVMADTMDLWLEIAREQLDEVLGKIDLLVINESEAFTYTSAGSLVAAARILLQKGPRYVVIKLGAYGALLASGQEQLQWFSAPAWPLEQLVDPTGAGDSFLGAMAGYVALQLEQGRAIDFALLKEAVMQGCAAGSFCCEDFSTHALQAAGAEGITRRVESLRKISSLG